MNHVYATYEVHDDPRAEVRTICSFQTKENSIMLINIQVQDQNLNYGVVYEGEMSKTTDVNPDYDDDYDYMS